MIVREKNARTQIAVLEDGVLVEHYVSNQAQTSMVGNVYLGRVQNVLPSMEAAFVDVGKGRNAVLYAGEVNWDAAGLEGGSARRIEQALKSGDPVLVQVTKDPIGHKGARLTSQVTLAGRYLVYVPGGGMTGISRKLPDTERNRLKRILREIVPESAGVIVRTAAEGASEDELRADIARLQGQWEAIEKKSKSASAPALLQGEPDMAIRVVRDIFNDDFSKLVVEGDEAWSTISSYIDELAPDLAQKVERWTLERRRVRRAPHRRAAGQGHGPQGLAAVGRLARDRPDRGHERRRRQHRQVHRLGRHARGDGDAQQPRGRRGDRPPAPAARHRRDHRHRLHRHGARVQPRPRAAAPASSAWAGTGPSTRSPRSPRSASCR